MTSYKFETIPDTWMGAGWTCWTPGEETMYGPCCVGTVYGPCCVGAIYGLCWVGTVYGPCCVGVIYGPCPFSGGYGWTAEGSGAVGL